MAKKDPTTSYSVGVKAGMQGVTPYQVPGAYASNVSNGKKPGEQKNGPAPHQVPGAYASNVKDGAKPGEQGSGLAAGATQPTSGEKGNTGGSGNYPMSKNAAWNAGIGAGVEQAALELALANGEIDYED